MTDLHDKEKGKDEMKCQADEGCENKMRYTLTDHKLNNSVSLCKEHFKKGLEAFFEPNPIIKFLKHKGIL